jgi:hypothetical protein
LSFYDDALDKTTNSENYKEFVARNRDLCKLARRTISGEDPPLCMSITGPAGAGKCKSRRTRTHKTETYSYPVRKSKTSQKFGFICKAVQPRHQTQIQR